LPESQRGRWNTGYSASTTVPASQQMTLPIS
jgi:hypothetical protein